MIIWHNEPMSLRIMIVRIAFLMLLSLVLLSTAGAQDAVSGSSVFPSPDPFVNSKGEEKIVVGAREMVYFPAEGTFLVARVDSGAAFSSLHASQIQRFERDGEVWVRFNLDFDGTDRIMERRVERFVHIHQAGSVNISERPVVNLDIRLGRYSLRLSFNLTNRRHMTFPLILGRDFLSDRALVDVSNEFLMSSR